MQFTAWITTDTDAISGDKYEIDVFEVDELGAMATTDTELSAVGNMSADNDHADILEDAESILEGYGWHLAGQWEDVSTGYTRTVSN